MNYTALIDKYRRQISIKILWCHRSTFLAILLIIIPSLYIVQIWLFSYKEASIQIELLDTSNYVWSSPESETFFNQLHKIVEWRADSVVERIRPLNDLAEVIDAIARPYLTQYLTLHPSFTPFSLLTAVFSPFFLFLYLRQIGRDNVRAAALLIIFLSSIGFLSVIIPYIRPAKKLAILLLCVCLYLAYRHARSSKPVLFWIFIATLFLSFFADEMGLANYFIMAVLFYPTLIGEAPNWKRLVYLSLPILSVITVRWGLPAIYANSGFRTQIKVTVSDEILQLFGHLIDPSLYWIGLRHTARAFLTTIGIVRHNSINEWFALITLIGGTLFLVYFSRSRKIQPTVDYNLFAITICLIATGIYTTFLDFFTFPGEINHLGSFTYYYHSPLVVLIVIWLGFTWDVLIRITQRNSLWGRYVVASGVAVCILVTIANLSMFHAINKLATIIHTYPYSSETIHNQIATKLPELRTAVPGRTVAIDISPEPAKLTKEFETTLQMVFGPTWRDNGFYDTFETFKNEYGGMGAGHYLNSLLHAYFPYLDVVITTSIKKPERLTEEKDTTALYHQILPGEVLQVGLPVQNALGEKTPLGVEDLVLMGDLLMRVEPNGVTPILGNEGQSIKIENLGVWNHKYQNYEGISAIFQDGRWFVLEDFPAYPDNSNFDFSEGTETEPIPDWWIASDKSNSYEVTRMHDETGPFIRIKAIENISFLTIGQTFTGVSENKIPISLRAEFRTSCNCHQVLTLLDEVDPTSSDERQVYTSEARQAAGQWHTLMISGASILPSQGDHYSIGMFDVKAGDWFDIREFGMYVGRLP